MANHFAVARLMPHRRFLVARDSLRHHVALISRRFCTSQEQTAHRISTLPRPYARGIAFRFVLGARVGNISKRFSADRCAISRFGGTCLVWKIRAAFESNNQVQNQFIHMPEGGRYFSIARTATAAGCSHTASAPRFAIGLGCDVAYAPRLIDANGIDLSRVRTVDRGLNCQLCERTNCTSRAGPLHRRLAIFWLDGASIFVFHPPVVG